MAQMDEQSAEFSTAPGLMTAGTSAEPINAAPLGWMLQRLPTP